MFLLAYYSKEGIGVYQGDPLSPLLFGFISHFLLEKINSLAIHVQMFADDLILIMKGSMIEINYQLQKIYKIIKDFGMNPNDDKTKKTLIPKEILYLGIWLDKKNHLKFNFEKVNNNFEKILHTFKERNFSNGLTIQFFKAVLHSQLLYGLEIFDFTESDFKKIDIWINKKITESLLINPHSPRLIYKTEAKIDLARITIYKRKFKLIQKLKILGFDKLINLLLFREKEKENINWKARNLKELESELEVYRINQLKNSPNLDIIEDLDHFLWNCPAYENNRKIWISELEKNNFSLILNNNIIYNIINKQDSISLLALVDNKTMFESIIRFLNSSLGIRANKRNSKLLP
ncbi:115 kda protein in type-1 retrotransposable element r1dm-like protein-related [Anaeramoeba flamelloides]|uniref:115 kDa protein in type-1 retrotransposable element r1dm-like protein-related n=1 Tax=Anaeramoeba flamelloides TaxID=1746091 RepID=A0AAV7YG39_9EUKA|nr:115 kda protein in type-1 retrotransposable element r1dm-like protein-related [Anaeramoeba flamelloides]